MNIGPERHAAIELGSIARLAVLAVPGGRGSFGDQAEDLFAQVQCIVRHQPVAVTPTTMIVFLRDGSDEAECERIVSKRFGSARPVTTYVAQAPCSGAALGLELWAAGGANTIVQRLGPQLVSVQADGIRWVHCGGLASTERPAAERGRRIVEARGAYAESMAVLERMKGELARAGVGFDQVVRTWIYLNQITDQEGRHQRYQEFNRARSDFYRPVEFGAKHRASFAPETVYPASTGIGTRGDHVTMSCMALHSDRPDVFLMPLENPQQTAAYDYHARYSPHSPKFSRAMAVVQGHFVTTLVSGTASIVDARTCHPGDIVAQTEQTIDNIERLIAAENFARHGMPGGGATLRDVAKLRVYVKNLADYQQCRAVCERRLPRVPVLYLHADICRPNLLVEIEAVAFSPYRPGKGRRPANAQAAKRMGA